jgi:hypothetical protein
MTGDLPRWRAAKRPATSVAPPGEVEMIMLIVLPS